MNDAERLLKIQGAVKEMVANGESTDYIDNFLAQQGESAESLKAINQYGAESIARSRKAVQEQKASQPANTVWSHLLDKESLAAGLQGLGLGTEKVLSGATLGGYDWLNKKLGGTYEQRVAENQQLAEEAGLGGLNKIGTTVSELSGALMSPIARALPSGATTVAGKIGQGALGGTVLGGLSSAFESDFDPTATMKGAGLGAALGGAIPAAIESVKGLGKVVLGTTTGTGARAIERAGEAGQRGSKEFLQNMRGQVDEMQVVEDANRYVNNLKQQASQEYLAGKTGMINKKVDIKPILDSVDDIERGFNYKGLNTANAEEQRVIAQTKQYLDDLIKNPNAQDIGGVDSIKQAIGRINTTDPSGLRVRFKIYNSVKEAINKVDPQYAKVMGKYETAAKSLDNISKELSAGKRGANPYTVLGKLQSALRNDVGTRYGARVKAVKALGDTASEKILDAVAGQSFSTLAPRGLSGRLTGLLTGGGAVLGGNLGGLATLPLFSPRLVGEAVYGLGRLSSYAPSLQQALAGGSVFYRNNQKQPNLSVQFGEEPLTDDPNAWYNQPVRY
ncbi:MAG: hypothetical protein MJ156_00460 [Alphaproteobacteria bacterium]|nr:hypothetical protein [Alphaproteobacteria bacterium]